MADTELDPTDPTTRVAARHAQAADTLRRLVEGNRRFAAGTPLARGPFDQALVNGQHPVAVVLGCVDARVPPEIVLDQGVDDLLTVRTAGQSLSGVAMGSLDFGVRVLDVPLLVVLGHTGCGAVLAAISGDHITGYLGELVSEIAGRLVDVVGDDDPIKATGGNLQATVDALRDYGLAGRDGDPVHVVGVLYDLGTGTVSVADDDGLLAADG